MNLMELLHKQTPQKIQHHFSLDEYKLGLNNHGPWASDFCVVLFLSHTQKHNEDCTINSVHSKKESIITLLRTLSACVFLSVVCPSLNPLRPLLLWHHCSSFCDFSSFFLHVFLSSRSVWHWLATHQVFSLLILHSTAQRVTPSPSVSQFALTLSLSTLPSSAPRKSLHSGFIYSNKVDPIHTIKLSALHKWRIEGP